MAESMSEQIFSIACALSKADESESGWGGVLLPARGRPDSDEAFVR